MKTKKTEHKGKGEKEISDQEAKSISAGIGKIDPKTGTITFTKADLELLLKQDSKSTIQDLGKIYKEMK